MEERFFKYAILLSLALHAALLVKIHITDPKERVTIEEKTAVSYKIERPRPQPPENFIQKAMAFEARPVETLTPPVPQPVVSSDFLQEQFGMGEQFKMYERAPEKVKGMKVTKEVSVPMLKSEKINTPSYITYYQIVRDRIRERAYTNYTKLSMGEVYLTFIIKEDGSLNDLQIMENKSEGNEFLRNVGLKSVQEASPFPPFPKDLNYPELTFNVQISFQYREGE